MMRTKLVQTKINVDKALTEMNIEKQLSNSSISNYLKTLQSYPQLNHEQLVELFKSYEKGGNESKIARKKLAESNLRLVVYVAKKHKGHNIPIEDLIQEGNLGLLKAIERFDWSKGFRFSTYAMWWIKQAISQYVLKRKKIIRLPAYVASAQKKMIEAVDSFRESTGHEPTIEELSSMVDVSESVVKATMQSGRNVISLQQSIDDSRENSSTLEDRLEDTNIDNNPFDCLAKKEMIGIVRNVMCRLTAKEAAILRLRFGLFDDVESEKYVVDEEVAQQISMGQGIQK
jgi:RNA polymerase primary sigma factor